MADRLWNENDSFAIAFNIGGWSVRWYAIFVVLGFLIAIIIGCYRAKMHYKIKYDCLYYFAIILVPVALFGARFWSACIGDLNWNIFFDFTKGGLAIQGGVVFVLIASMIYFPLILKNPKYHVRVEDGNKVYIRKPSIWIILDICTPVILIGQAIGRWGNFFNGELFGQAVDPNNMQWLKVIMPGVYDHMFAQETIGGVVAGTMYQPLFLYESFINIISFVIIYFVLANIKSIRAGVIGSSYFLIYGIIRFSLEPLRHSTFTFTGTYVMNALLLTLGIVLIIIAQFIAPRYRHKQVIYYCWCKYVRLNYIKLLKKLKIDKAESYLSIDPKLEKYGFEKKPTFTRNQEQMLYYGPNDLP